MSLAQLKKWIEAHRAEVEKDYFEFLRFASISADPEFAQEMQKCSHWLQNYIEKHTDLKAAIIDTKGYPLVYAESRKNDSSIPTVLIYGHYDVQPVDPLELWKSKPFEPTHRDGKIYARGAVDDKGQIFYAVVALRAMKELGIAPAANVKLCIEGEEESSSKGLSESLRFLKDKLKTDFLLVVDFDQFDPQTPALSLGARGILSLEVKLIGSNSDLHSGIHGGMAYNPNKALVQLLSQLWDESGRIVVPGFYDDVLEPEEKERTHFAFRYTKESYAKEFGITAIGGEKGKSLVENNTLRPTLEINGIGGGYTGAGFKTVIPKEAIAKISCRLVPNQDPEKLICQLTQFLQKHVPGGMKMEITSFGGEAAFRGSASSPLAKAVSNAATEVTGKECKNMLSGASIPIIAKMQGVLGCEVVGMGYGLPTDDIHAPNEHFEWSRFEKGFLTVARALEKI
jgi:acetylornithine deacetylase/succinyl-diaminopimelate desuccinylase-like protein